MSTPRTTSMIVWAVAVIAALASTAAVRAGGTVIRVPADQATIQDAINAAFNGDEVVISAGTYNETISFGGKAITVRGDTGDPTDVIIDGGASGTSVVTCAASEGAGSRLIGLTVTNGAVGLTGGGLFINMASPTVSNCRFTGNTAASGGGAIVVIGGIRPLPIARSSATRHRPTAARSTSRQARR